MKKAQYRAAITAAIGALCTLPTTAAAVAAHFGMTPGALIFNDGETVEELQQRMIDLRDEAQGIDARSRVENREPNAEEQQRINEIFAEFESVEARVDMAQRRSPVSAGTSMTTRRVEANGFQRQVPEDHTTRAQQARQQREPRASVPASPRSTSAGSGGFRDEAEFFMCVMRASAQGGRVDPRLVANAPTTYGQEGVGADGGFAVPPDFRENIVQKVMGEDSLLSRTDQMTTSSNAITVPADQTTPWQETGGIQAYWESEAGQKQQSKPSLSGLTVKANKIIALVPLTDELLEDAPAMASYVNRKAPEKIDYKVNAAIIAGTGVGMPMGILNSPGTVTVAAESGQVADSIVYDNIVNMYGRLPAQSKRRAVWLANADIETQLMKMKFPGSDANPVPVYLPPGGLSASPYGTLLGRPIITSEAMPALGDAGDLVLADLSQYLSVVKAGGIRQDVSIHVFFDYDVTAFRFVLRVGGQPWWNAPIERTNGQASRAFFVKLGAR
ncbi:MAG TPA: phage major capsid protein [Burkholderiales bacterium]|nr:phage major capsid protein [Burkholderiales bacterium]